MAKIYLFDWGGTLMVNPPEMKGKVTAGMDVVNMIAYSRTATIKGHEDVPSEAIVIKKVTIK